MSSATTTPLTTRYPQLIEAFMFIKDEYAFAKLSWCSPAAYQHLNTTTSASKAANTEFPATAAEDNILDTPATYAIRKLALAALDELYAAYFPEETIF